MDATPATAAPQAAPARAEARRGVLRHIVNVYRLGVKELWSLARDPTMFVLIIYTFTASVYSSATAQPDTLHMAPIAIIDEDHSPLSQRIASAFFPPQFTMPSMTTSAAANAGMDAGMYTFSLNIPPNFQRDVLGARRAEVQLNVDATRMSQAFTGSGYVQQIVTGGVQTFLNRYRSTPRLPVELALRVRFNPSLEHAWFGALMQIINNITMVSIILTGAALIREREHGTIEHLLVMPVTPAEIMLSKVWSMGLVVLIAAAMSLQLIVRGALQVPIAGSQALFLCGAALLLFATTSMGIFMATLARSMPQFGMLLVLVLLPLQMLSGGNTPRESMPKFVQEIMLAAPTTHFVELSQAILFRGAGIEVVWVQFVGLVVIGAAFFAISLRRFRKTISQMA